MPDRCYPYLKGIGFLSHQGWSKGDTYTIRLLLQCYVHSVAIVTLVASLQFESDFTKIPKITKNRLAKYLGVWDVVRVY